MRTNGRESRLEIEGSQYICFNYGIEDKNALTCSNNFQNDFGTLVVICSFKCRTNNKKSESEVWQEREMRM